MRIVVTGNPGTGKHIIGRLIAKRLNLQLIDLNEFVLCNNLVLPTSEFKSYNVNIKKASKFLKKEVKSTNNFIIIGHLAPYLLISKDVDFVVVLRRSPLLLLQMFKERGYTEDKIRDNITCEILDICLYDTLKKFRKSRIFEFDTTEKSTSKTVRCIIEALNDKTKVVTHKVNWLSKIDKNENIIKFLSQ